MDKGIEAIREAVRRAPLTKPEGLSPAWQAYFDAVTPLHVAELIATLEQAQQEYKAIEQKLISAAVYIETLESEPRKTNLKQLNELAEMRRKCSEFENQKFDTAKLINKFYTRYPLESFKSDPERAEVLGYYMAGAEVQHFGDFVVYEMPEDDEGSE